MRKAWPSVLDVSGLAPILAPNLRVVFCGTAVGERSAARGHYYAGPGNDSWSLLFQSSLTPTLLKPEDDRQLPVFGLGLTDLAPGVTQSHDRGLTFDVAALLDTVEAYRPRFLALTSKRAAQVTAGFLGFSTPGLGLQAWELGRTQVFVLPSSSGANRRRDYSGRSTRLEWWAELGALAS